MQQLAVGLIAGKFLKFAFMQILSSALIVRVAEAASGNEDAKNEGFQGRTAVWGAYAKWF